jgi:hypothetical protein
MFKFFWDYLIHYFCNPRFASSFNAEVAHLVEHNLAKVGVAGSSPVFRSQIPQLRDFFSA